MRFSDQKECSVFSKIDIVGPLLNVGNLIYTLISVGLSFDCHKIFRLKKKLVKMVLYKKLDV